MNKQITFKKLFMEISWNKFPQNALIEVQKNPLFYKPHYWMHFRTWLFRIHKWGNLPSGVITIFGLNIVITILL